MAELKKEWCDRHTTILRAPSPAPSLSPDVCGCLLLCSGGAYYLHLGSDSCRLDVVGTYSLSLWVSTEDGARLKVPREVVLTFVTQSGTPTYFDSPGTPLPLPSTAQHRPDKTRPAPPVASMPPCR